MYEVQPIPLVHAHMMYTSSNNSINKRFYYIHSKIMWFIGKILHIFFLDKNLQVRLSKSVRRIYGFFF